MANKIVKRQIINRTYRGEYEKVSNLLKQGWMVKFATPILNNDCPHKSYIEYILEKEELVEEDYR